MGIVFLAPAEPIHGRVGARSVMGMPAGMAGMGATVPPLQTVQPQVDATGMAGGSFGAPSEPAMPAMTPVQVGDVAAQ
jgi:hypothetical protein